MKTILFALALAACASPTETVLATDVPDASINDASVNDAGCKEGKSNPIVCFQEGSDAGTNGYVCYDPCDGGVVPDVTDVTDAGLTFGPSGLVLVFPHAH